MVYDRNTGLGALVVEAPEMGWFGILWAQSQRDSALFICFFFLPKWMLARRQCSRATALAIKQDIQCPCPYDPE